ncbi:MAG: polyphosphate kinase 1 [Chitinispirillaceae bacterium]|jgi:polyphosphate kinase|nr:polyphosphate kinase 1 [Chitinispirillaceae bacterium]
MSSHKNAELLNRELSWMEFNQRVLDCAQDPKTPLLERLKFLAITASNLDEFFMVRVGELQLLTEQRVNKRDPAGMTPADQLAAISARARLFTREQQACCTALMALLDKENIRRLSPNELSPGQARHAERIFTTEIFPVLSPIAVPSTGDFPLLAGTTIHLAVRLAAGRTVVIPVPRVLSRIISLPVERGYAYMLLEELIAMHAGKFFPGETVVECVPFRITRNAAMRADDEPATDLLAEMTGVLTRRKRSDCLRLEIQKSVSRETLTFLQKGLRLQKQSLYPADDVLDYTVFMRITQLPGHASLKDDPWLPVPLLLAKQDTTMFQTITRGDIITHQPYESFDPVIRFLEEAAADPDVIAIKQTLYRTGKKSRVVAALARAAENGKYVTAIVELKARFDEERNIGWARQLEDAGVQVIYGIKRFKTHAKICLVIRKEGAGVRKYMHFGTGNYNELTAQLYTDVGFFTCHEDLGADASSFFNVITGHSQPQMFRKIAAAPIDMRETVVGLIRTEAEHARQGHTAFIRVKLNSLVDEQIIRALCAASQEGVIIQLNVRGICCLRPGVRGLSENIHVVSIVDRFLEHSRIFQFHAGGSDRFFISSADWMGRNLDKRCELFVPIEDSACKKRLSEILDLCFRDNAHAWTLLSDGSYERIVAGRRLRLQETLYRRACEAAASVRRRRSTEFETHAKAS